MDRWMEHAFIQSITHRLLGPLPVFDFGHVDTILGNKMFVLGEQFLHFLSDVRCRPLGVFVNVGAFILDHVANILDQVKAVDAIHYTHVECSRDRSFFLVSANDKVAVGPSKNEFVDKVWVSMEIKKHWLVLGEDGIKFLVAQSMRMLFDRGQSHQIYNIDESDFDIGKLLSQD